MQTQNVLWEGEFYMQGSQSASLKESISQQKTGISLVFSPYADGVSKDYIWIEHFVPKKIVALRPSAGHNFQLYANGNGATMCEKYLYISDTEIRGNDGNKDAPNNKWVLRYVIGI